MVNKNYTIEQSSWLGNFWWNNWDITGRPTLLTRSFCRNFHTTFFTEQLLFWASNFKSMVGITKITNLALKWKVAALKSQNFRLCFQFFLRNQVFSRIFLNNKAFSNGGGKHISKIGYNSIMKWPYDLKIWRAGSQ